VRRPHGADGQLLHVPRLRDEYRLLLTNTQILYEQRAAETRLSA
jgi:hypothetical protein